MHVEWLTTSTPTTQKDSMCNNFLLIGKDVNVVSMGEFLPN
jgi:hypothetical protein